MVFDHSNVGDHPVRYIRFLLDNGQARKDQENVRAESQANLREVKIRYSRYA